MNEYPEPKTFNGAPGEVFSDNAQHYSSVHPTFYCLDCSWKGKEAYKHHMKNHHSIMIKGVEHWGRLRFACCKTV
jgi:hypothetical protein